MPFDDGNAASKVALDLLNAGSPAEYRSIPEVITPLQATYGEQSQTFGKPIPYVVLLPPRFDIWLYETLLTIEAHRDIQDGWDGQYASAPTNKSLDAAKTIAGLLLIVDSSRRPKLCIDAMGCPSFAINRNGLYVHLTVDAEGSLTWYAVNNGVDYFSCDVVFDGGKLPFDLETLFCHPT